MENSKKIIFEDGIKLTNKLFFVFFFFFFRKYVEITQVHKNGKLRL